MKRYALAAILLASICGLAAPSRATVVDQVNADNIDYDPFSGSIDQGATGSNAKLNWKYFLDFQSFTLDFTNASNVITDVLFSSGGDNVEFDGHLSGNPAIGTICVAVGNVGCLQATGTTQDVTSQVGNLAGYSCCDGSLSVVVGDAIPVPEPAPIAVFGTAVAGLVLLRRRHRA
jgi:hypothetical protein